MSEELYIENYSQKSFVVRGNTVPFKNDLKKLGGKWNSRLTDKKNGEKFGAWLFWSDKKKDIEEWLKNGCDKIVSNNYSEDMFELINKLQKEVELLEKRINVLEKNESIEEECEKPMKRLLKR